MEGARPYSATRLRHAGQRLRTRVSVVSAHRFMGTESCAILQSRKRLQCLLQNVSYAERGVN